MLGKVCSWFCDGVDYLSEKVSDGIDYLSNVVVGGVTYCVNKVQKTWASMNGADIAAKAEQLYEQTKEKLIDAEKNFTENVSSLTAQMNDQVGKLNRVKAEIHDVHFKRFLQLANRLHNVTVKGQPFNELFDDSEFKHKETIQVRAKHKLLEIDFNNMSLGEKLQMYFTFGWSSKQKAKKSLANVEDEEKRIDSEIAKLNSHIKKLEQVKNSIMEVSIYFDELIGSYESLLKRFEYGIQTQRFKQMALSDNVFSAKLDFRLMPIVHIQEFQALFNMSLVLKKMASLGYLSDKEEQVEVSGSDLEQAVALRNNVRNLFQNVA
ncbi:DNA repair protein [Thalassotalea aquiviva]|uniref:DNA repair protein n=1 Tax=Thalassotalea aquiviva TaxID=3242415 RepID=UPI00352B7563